jgi:hypothetical protein
MAAAGSDAAGDSNIKATNRILNIRRWPKNEENYVRSGCGLFVQANLLMTIVRMADRLSRERGAVVSMRELSWQWRILKGRKWFHRFWVWMCPVALVGYALECYFGGGLSGWLIRKQIETKGSMGVGLWTAASFFVWMVPPAWMATVTASKEPVKSSWTAGQVFGLLMTVLLGISGGALWIGHSGPSLEETPKPMMASESDPGERNRMVRLGGLGHREMGVQFVAVRTKGSGATRYATAETVEVTPFTSKEWRSGTPVRFVLYATGDSAGRDGVMLRNSLPWYLTSLIEKRGVKLAKPYYVVYTNSYMASQAEWDAIAAISGFFGVMATAGFVIVMWPKRKL